MTSAKQAPSDIVQTHANAGEVLPASPKVNKKPAKKIKGTSSQDAQLASGNSEAVESRHQNQSDATSQPARKSVKKKKGTLAEQVSSDVTVEGAGEDLFGSSANSPAKLSGAELEKKGSPSPSAEIAGDGASESKSHTSSPLDKASSHSSPSSGASVGLPAAQGGAGEAVVDKSSGIQTWLGIGGLVVGAAGLAAARGGGGGGSSSSSVVTAPLSKMTLNVKMVAGPADQTSDVMVMVYDAKGNLLTASAAVVDPKTGAFTLNWEALSAYRGMVLIKVLSTVSDGDDYVDEMGGKKDLGVLRAVVEFTGDPKVIHYITPLTELAVLQMGVASGEVTPPSKLVADAANISVGNKFNIGDGGDVTKVEPKAVVNVDGGYVEKHNAYGVALALISAAEKKYGKTTDEVLGQLYESEKGSSDSNKLTSGSADYLAAGFGAIDPSDPNSTASKIREALISKDQGGVLPVDLDTTAPALSSSTAPSYTLVGGGDGIGDKVELTITFDGAVNGLTSGTANGIFKVGATLVDATWSGSGSTRTLTYIVASGHNGQLTIDEVALKTALTSGITDASGNAFTHAGNISDIDASSLPMIDGTAPVAPVLSIATNVGDISRNEALAGELKVTAESGAAVRVVLQNGIKSVTKNLTGTGAAQSITLDASDLTALGDGTISVSATVTDGSGNATSTSAPFTFVLDGTAPALSSSTAPSYTLVGGGDGIGDKVELTITFDGAVNGLTSGTANGIFKVGATLVDATWSGSGSTRTLTYIVASGHNGQLTIDEAALKTALTSGITDASGNAFTHAGNISDIDASSLPMIDGTAPVAPVLSIATNVGDISRNEALAGELKVTAESGAAVRVVLQNGIKSVTKNLTGTGAAQSITLDASDLTALGDGTISVSATVTDGSGNATSTSAPFTFVLDGTAPALSSSTAPSYTLVGGGDGIGDKVELTITFDGAVNGLTSGTANGIFKVGATLVDATWSGSGSTRTLTYIVASGHNGQLTIDEAALKTALTSGITDASGNAFTHAGNISDIDASSLPMIDGTAPVAPVLSIATNVGDISRNEALAGELKVTAESGAAVRVVLQNGIKSVTKNLTGTGAAQSITLDASDLTALGDGTISVSATVTDGSGNATSTSAPFTFVLDGTAPALSSSTAPSYTLVGGGDGIGDKVELTITFDGAVNGLTSGTANGIFKVGATLVDATWSGSGSTRTLTYIVASGHNGQLTIDEAALKTALTSGITDASGNAFTHAGNISDIDASSLPMIDGTAPVAPVLSIATNVGDISRNEALAGELKVTAESGAAVRVVLQNGIKSVTKNLTGTGAAQSITLDASDLTALGDGTISVSATVTDGSGNATSTSAPFTFVLDGTAPALSSSTAPSYTLVGGGDGIGDKVELTITFDGAVNGLTSGTANGIFKVGATLVDATWSGSGSTRTLTYIVASGHNGQLTIDEVALKTALTSGITDASGNAFTHAGNISDIDASSLPMIDGTAPVAPVLSIATNVGDISRNEALAGELKVTAESGAAVRVVLQNGIKSVTKNLTGTGAAQSITLDASDLTALGDGTISVSATVTDGSGNATSTSAPFTFVLDGTAPALSSSTAPSYTLVGGGDGIGDKVELTITFDGAVNGLTSGTANGIFKVGATLVDATWSGSGSTRTLTYIVASGHNGQLTIDEAALKTALTSGITDASGNAFTHAGNISDIDASSLPMIDGTAPVAPVLSIATNVGDISRNEALAGELKVTAESGAAVRVVLQNGIKSVTKNLTGTGAAQSITLDASDLTALGDGTISVSATVTDGSGNATSTSAPFTFVLDGTAPALSSSTAPSYTLVGGGDGIGDKVELTITFDGAVNGLTSGTANGIFKVGATLVDATWSGSGSTRTLTYIVASGHNGQLTIDEAALKTALTSGITDASGNAFTHAGNISDIDASSLPMIDGTAPALSSSTAPSYTLVGGGDGIGDKVELTITFDGAVNGLTSGTANGIFKVGATLVDATWSGSGSTRTLTYIVASGHNGQLTIDEAALKTALTSGITDASGNAFTHAGNISDIDASSLPMIDGTAPALSSSTAPSYTLVGGGDGIGDKVELTITFDGAVNGLTSGTANGIFKVGATLVDATWSGSGSTRTLTYIVASGHNGQLTIDEAALKTALTSGITDASGNAFTHAGNISDIDASSLPMIDGTAPVAPVLSIATNVGDISRNEALAGELKVTAESGAAVRVVLQNGIKSVTKNLTGTGAAQSITLDASDLTALGDGTISVSATVTDGSGNATSTSAPFTFVLDGTAPVAPVLSIATNVGDISRSEALAGELKVTAESGAAVRVVLQNGIKSVTKNLTGTGAAQSITLDASDLTALGDGTISVSATVTDGSGNATSTSAPFTFVLDGTAPALSSSTAPSYTLVGGGDGIGDKVELTITFDGAVNGLTSGTANGIFKVGATLVDATWSGSGSTRTLTYIVASGHNGQLTIDEVALKTALTSGITDASGNAFTHAGNISDIDASSLPMIDGTAPVAPVLSIATNVGDISRSEALAGELKVTAESGAAVRVVLQNGIKSVTKNLTGTGAAQSITLDASDLTALGDGTISVSATVTDGSGNATSTSAPFTFTLDTVAPTVSITCDRTSLKSGDQATVFFSFSEPMSSFTSSNIDAVGGVISSIGGGGRLWYATFTPNTTSSTHSVQVLGTTFADTSGNAGSNSNLLTFNADITPPTVAITRNGGSGVVNGSELIKFEFSEQPDDFVLESILCEGGTLTNFVIPAQNASSHKWESFVTFTPTSNSTGNAKISVQQRAFLDLAGNYNLAATPLDLTVDTISPTVAIVRSGTGVIKGGSTETLTFVFSEKPTGFAESDIVVTGGAKSEYLPPVLQAGGVYDGKWVAKITFTPDANYSGSANISVAANQFKDGANNDNVRSEFSLPVDTRKPTVTITADKASLKAGEVATITFEFSEDPGSTFDLTKIIKTNGTLGPLSGSGLYRFASFTPDANVTSGRISVGVNKFADGVGNFNDELVELNLTVDNTPPTVAITRSGMGNMTGAETITFLFSENPVDFDPAVDIAVSGGTLGALSGFTQIAVGQPNAGQYLATALFTPTTTNNGTASISIAAGLFADGSGNVNVASSLTIGHVDTIAPVVEIKRANPGTVMSGADEVITFLFSEQPSSFTLADDVVVVGGSFGVLSLVEQLTSGPNAGKWAATATFTPDTGATSVSIAIASGNIADGSTNTNAAAAALALTVDRTPPTVAITTDADVGLASGMIRGGGEIRLKLTFSEQPIGFDPAADIVVMDSTNHPVTTGFVLGKYVAPVSGSGSTWVGYISLIASSSLASGNLSIGVAGNQFKDVPGTWNTAGTSFALTVDNTPPTVAITRSGMGNMTGAETITFLFSENPVDFDPAVDIAVSGGTLGALSGFTQIAVGQPNAGQYLATALFTPTTTNNGTASISIAAGLFADGSGNVNVASSLTIGHVDTIAPVVEIKRANPGTVMSGADEVITFLFSEQPSSFTLADDVVVVGGSFGVLSLVEQLTSGPNAGKWAATATFTPDTGATSVSIAIASGNIADGSTNTNAAAAALALTVDRTPPTVAITTDADVGLASGMIRGGGEIRLKLTFSEQPIGFDPAADIVVMDSTNHPVTTGFVLGKYVAPVSGSGSTWVGYISLIASSSLASGNLSIGVAGNQFKDVPGTWNTAGTSFALTVDNTPPTVAITRSGMGNMTGAETITFLFSENPVDFDPAVDIAVSGGTLGALSGFTQIAVGQPNAGQYLATALFTPTTTNNGTASISIAAGLFADGSGNVNVASSLTIGHVDTIAPVVEIKRANPGTVMSGADEVITFLFSEQPSSFTLADDVVVVGGSFGVLSLVEQLTSGPNAGKWAATATFTPDTGATSVSIAIASGNIADGSTNTNAAAAALALTVDRTPPTVAITTDADVGLASGMIRGGGEIRLKLTFSEQPIGFDPAADIVVMDSTNHPVTTGFVLGKYVAPVSGSGSTWVGYISLIASSSLASGNLSIGVAGNQFKDVPGTWNTAGTSFALTVDNTPPNPVLITRTDTSFLAAGTTAEIRFTFDEAPTGFTVNDITVIGGSISGLTEIVEGSGADSGRWVATATFTPTPGASSATIGVAANKFSDRVGNLNQSASVDLQIPLSTTLPTITAMTSDDVDNRISKSNTASTTITLTFSHDPGATFDLGDFSNVTYTSGQYELVVGGVTQGALSGLSGTGLQRTLSFTPAANFAGQVLLEVLPGRFQSASGDNNGSGASLSLAVDVQAPAVQISASKSSGYGGQTVLLTFTFSEDPTGFDVADIIITAKDAHGVVVPVVTGGLTAATLGGSGRVRTIAYELPDTANVTSVEIGVANAAFNDSFGNSSTTATPLLLSLDNVRPTLVISANQTKVAYGQTSVITFEFSEEPREFALSDLTVSGCELTNLSSIVAGTGVNAGKWFATADLTPDAMATEVSIAASANKFKDLVGNDNTQSNVLRLDVDATPPTVTITSSAEFLRPGDSTIITFTFSEEIAAGSFGLDDVVVSSGAISNLTGTGLTRTATYIAGSSLGAASIGVAANKFYDLGGLYNAVSATHALTIGNVQLTSLGFNQSAGGINGQHNAGDTITFAAEFSTVVTVSGAPQISLGAIGAGGVERFAIFDGAKTGAASTGTVYFTYTVHDGDNAPLGIGFASNALSLNGGAITGQSSIPAVITHAAVSPNANYRVDTLAPVALSVTLKHDTGDSNGDNITSDGTIEIGNLETGASWQYRTSSGGAWINGSGTSFVLPEGAYAAGAIAVRQIDGAGNPSTSTALSQAVTVDSTAPTAPTVSLVTTAGTQGAINVTVDVGVSYSVSFINSAKQSILKTRVGTGSQTTISLNSVEIAFLGEGSIDVRVIAKDTAGNQSEKTATIAIDLTPPPALTTTGAIPTLVWSDVEGAFTVTPEVGATWEFSLDGGETWATGVLVSNKWTPQAGVYAANQIQFRVLDAMSNISPVTRWKSALDTTFATVSIGVVSGDDRISGVEKASTSGVVVSGTSVGANGRDVTVQWGLFTKRVAVGSDGGWAVNFSSAEIPADGYSTITARVGARAGESDTRSVEVDTVAPTVGFNDVASDNIVNYTEKSSGVIVGGTSTGADGQSISVQWGTTIKQATILNGGNWSISFASADMPADANSTTITATVSDAAGNPRAATKSVRLDTQAPVAGVLSLSSDFNDSGIGGDNVTSDDTFTLTVTGNEAGSTISYQVSTDGGSTWAATNAAQSGLVDQTYRFRAQVSDTAGNVSTTSEVSVTVDKTAPVAGVLSLSSDFNDSGIGGDNVTSDDTFTLTVTGNEAGSTISYQVSTDGGSTWAATNAAQSGLVDQTYRFRAQVSDTAGNVSTTSEVSVTVDKTAPVGTLNAKALHQATAAFQTVTSNAISGTEAISGAVTNHGDKVIVKSTSIGKAYLVKDTETPTSVAALEALANNKWNFVSISAANVDTELLTDDLIAGTYKLYVADASGNLTSGVRTVKVVEGHTLSGTYNGVDVGGWNLIAGITIGGKTFYHLDASGDGLADATDALFHDTLDKLFNSTSTSSSAVDTTDANRSNGSLLAGYTLRLPTARATTGNATIDNSSNSSYDLAMIWDSIAAGAVRNGVPTDWGPAGGKAYWGATLGSANQHAAMYLDTGWQGTWNDGDVASLFYAALELIAGPTVRITSNKTTLIAGETATITFEFSADPGTSFDLNDVTLSSTTGGALSGLAGTGRTRTAIFTPGSSFDGAVSLKVLNNTFENNSTFNADEADPDNTQTITVDTVRPTVSITSDKTALAANQTATITFTFSEDPGASFTNADIVRSGGTLSTISGSGLTYTATFTADSSSTSASISIADGSFFDAMGNLNADGADANNAVSLALITGTLNAKALHQATAAFQTVTSNAISGAVTNHGDKVIVKSTSIGKAYLVKDTETPTSVAALEALANNKWNFVSISAANVDTELLTDDLIAGTYKLYVADASGNLTSGVRTVKVVEGHTLSGTYNGVDVGGWNLIAGITIGGKTFYHLDASGDGLADATDALFHDTLDKLFNSTSTSSSAVDTTDANRSNGSLLAGYTLRLPTARATTGNATIDNSSNSSYDLAMIWDSIAAGAVRNGVPTDWGPAGSKAYWGATLGSANQHAAMYLDTGWQGTWNDGDVASLFYAALELIAGPTVRITSNKTTLIAGETATITFEFSADPGTSFDLNDVTLSSTTGGALSGLAGTGRTRTAIFTPGSSFDGAVSLKVLNNTFENNSTFNADEADPDNTQTITVDTVRPTVSITSDKTALAANQTATITFTFSEDPGASFTNADIVRSGGTLSTISGSGLTYTATFTADSSSTSASISIADGSFFDAMGNLNADGADANNAVSLALITGTLNAKALHQATAAFQTVTSNAISGAVTNHGDKVIVKSTSIGKAYLVKDTETPTSVAALEALANNKWNFVSISAANVDTELLTDDLIAGTYKLYVADASGNLTSGVRTVKVVEGYTLSGTPNGVDVDGWNLIAGITIGGKTFYHLDASGDGLANATDALSHDILDKLFNSTSTSSSAVDTTDANRSNGSLLAGHTLRLPTASTVGGNAPIDNSGNSSYDLAMIWDSIAAGAVRNGVPTDWGPAGSYAYWGATLGSANQHAAMYLDTGWQGTWGDGTLFYAALQVL